MWKNCGQNDAFLPSTFKQLPRYEYKTYNFLAVAFLHSCYCVSHNFIIPCKDLRSKMFLVEVACLSHGGTAHSRPGNPKM